jgi:hypothetical protein
LETRTLGTVAAYHEDVARSGGAAPN